MRNKVIKIVFELIIFIFILLMSINFYIILSTKHDIYSADNLKETNDFDCILVLGAAVWGDRPSPMLEDRLNEAIRLYKNNKASKIIMSGDHHKMSYDEVNTMKNYAVRKGISSKDIFMDHAGFSTYESIYRAKEIFEAKKIIIVTQKYHLYRALYIARRLGIKAYGVNSDPRKYNDSSYCKLREILARNKDFIQCILKPKPTYLGESIPIFGDGNVTNDK